MAKNKEQQKPAQQPQGREEYRFLDYIYINLFFLAFLGIVALIVFISTGWKWDEVMKSVMKFIFFVFGGGFFAVSMFDFIYDRTAGKGNEEKQ
jgi:hypothetical protein